MRLQEVTEDQKAVGSMQKAGDGMRKAEEKRLGGFRDLRVYQLAYDLALNIFRVTKTFPKDEQYSLTDQIRRSSRSVAANIAEGFRRRQYPKMFSNKLAESDGEATESQVWIDFACDFGYLSQNSHDELIDGYEQVGRMLGSMISKPERFSP